MNLIPFDWRGPEFLVFYLVLSVLTVLVIWYLRRFSELGKEGEAIGQARELAEDPYRVAFLRGGRWELLHVALVSLIERGLLQVRGECLVTAGAEAVAMARRPLDKAILTTFTSWSQGRKADSIYTDTAVLAEADLIGEELQRRKLLPDEAVKESRKFRVIAAIAFLWIVAGIKILVALSRGHTNVGFLVLAAVLMAPVLILVSRRFRTALGDNTCRWIQSFFTNLRGRRESLELSSTNSELTFLAAAFGLAALPTAMGGVLEPLHLQPPKPATAAWGSCGSSCASFSSCGGGGGCGGGGCGGGGCGGCGS